MSKAAVRKNQADLLNQQKKDRKDLFAQRRQLASGTGSVNFGNLATNSGGGSGGGLLNVNIESSPNTNALIKTGDTMEGPLAFKPNNITISGGKLTMSTILLSNPTSWCIATGEGSAADDLNYIITQYNGTDVGALFSGQILILQAGVYNITLKHRGTSSSNIYIPSGSDLTLTGYTSGTSTGGEIAILMYDDQVVGGEWILVATSKPLGGGGTGMQNPATAPLDMNNYGIVDINVLEINSDGAGSANSFTMFGTTSAGAINLIDDTDYFAIQVDGTSKLRVYDTYVSILDTLDMNDDIIQNVNILYVNASGTNDASIDGQSTGLLYKVASSDKHRFYVNNVERMTVTSNDVEIQNWVDIRNPTTTVPSSAGFGDLHGWVKIQIDGGNYAFPIWAL